MEKPRCIEPPKVKNTIFLSPEWRKSMQESYDECISTLDKEKRERLERLKSIRNAINEVSLPWKDITVSPNKDATELTITNGIDTLTVWLWDDITSPAVTLSWIVWYSAWVYTYHTFDTYIDSSSKQTAIQVWYIAAVALKLLELKRYPENFGYKNIEYQLREKGSIEIFSLQNDDGKKPIFSDKYNMYTRKIGSYEDILAFISTVFRNIPKVKIQEDLSNNNDEWDWDMS